MKTRTFLATTGLDEFWDKSQPILFLGEWCKPYKNKDIWENLDYEVLDKPLIDQDPDAALCYIDKVYSDLLPLIAGWLNKIHMTSHSSEYWEIVLGPFLFSHIRTVYDRYHRLKKAYSIYPELTTIGMHESSFFTPLNTSEYFELAIHNDSLNLQIMTQLITLAFTPITHCKYFSWAAEKKQRTENLKIKPYRLLTKIKIYLFWFLVKLRGPKAVALLISYAFGKKAVYRFIFSSAFKILPIFPRNFAQKETFELIATVPDLVLRKTILNLPVTDIFSKLSLELLVTNMPMSFVENYEKECCISEKQYPYFAKVVFGISFIGDEAMRLWVARNRARGSKKLGCQHGGGYGALKSDSVEFMEHKFSDFYIAWGLKNTSKIISSPSVSCSILVNEQEKNKIILSDDKILWIATEFTKYPHDVKQALGANHYETVYHSWHLKIIRMLQPDIFAKTIMRLRYTDWSDNWNYLQDEFPSFKLHKPKDRMSFFQQIQTAKLLLFDNLNTTHLYGLVLNIPSILFWDEEVWTLRDEVKHYFDLLKKSGIFHTTPESAADMINKVGSDPSTWWNREDVQYARKQYCDYFIKDSKNWVNEWKDILVNFLDRS